MTCLFSFIGKVSIMVLWVLCLTTAACSPKSTPSFPDPRIKIGVAKLSGKLTGFERPDGHKLSMEVRLMNVVTASTKIYEIELNEDNCFYLEIPVESDMIWSTIAIAEYYLSCVFSTHRETRVELRRDGRGRLEASMNGYVNLTNADMVYWMDILGRIIESPSSADRKYTIDQEKYVDGAMEGIERISGTVRNDSILSEPAKNILINGFKMIALEGVLFDYSGMIRLQYQNTHPKEEWDKFVAPPEPGKSYYKFLRHFNLNNPQYLYTCDLYPRVLQRLLTIDALAIPPIGETPIAGWLKDVQASMADLVGFSDGQFYDLLVSNAYGRQFEIETKPLSEKQIANVNAYFHGDKAAFAEILLRRNAEIQKLSTGVGAFTVNETLTVPDDKLLDAIMSKHKGKVVVIDFWATWCGPCLQAMKQIREMKSEFKPDGVAYVYLTNRSSPEKLWSEMIRGIGGDHYYLTDKQWEYLMDHFEFGYIPSYSIYDANGKLHEKFVSYPGNATFQEVIMKLLPE